MGALYIPETAADINAEPANSNIQTHIGITSGNPHGTTAANIGAAAASHNQAITTITNLTGELEGKQIKHGWNESPPVITELSMSGNVFSLTPASGTGEYYYHGTEVIFTGAKSIDLSTGLVANTMHYIYFDDATAELKDGTGVWNLFNIVPIATAFYNGTTWAITEERHGALRNIPWHAWAHQTIGCRYYTGFDLTAPTVALPATVNISSGTLYDEDIKRITAQATSVRHWYKSAATTWTFVDPATTAYETTNKYTNASWQQVDVTAAKYINMWLYGSLDKDKCIYAIREIVAQDYTSIANARAVTPPNLNLAPYEFAGNADLKLLYRIIWKGDDTVAEVTDYRQSSPIAGGGTGATSAAAVTYTPTSPETFVTVQGALDNRAYIGDITASRLTATDNTIPVGTGTGIELATLGASLAYNDTNNIISAPFRVALMPGSFNLTGASTEPLLIGLTGTHRSWAELQFSATSDNTAGFEIPSARTASYNGGTIYVKIDFYHTSTVTTTSPSISFAIGLESLAEGINCDQTMPTSSTGYNTGTYEIVSSDNNLLRSIIISLTSPALTAGNKWIGYIKRLTAVDYCATTVNVFGVTVYE